MRCLANLGGVQSSSITSGDTTAQETYFVQRGPVVHLCQGDLRHHSVLGECAAAHEVEQALAFAGKSGGPIRHHAFTLREPEEDELSLLEALEVQPQMHLPDLLAQVSFGVFAELAFSTLWNVQRYDSIP